MNEPPYDLSLLDSTPKPPEWAAGVYDIYAQSVQYVAENPDRFEALNALMLKDLIDEEL